MNAKKDKPKEINTEAHYTQTSENKDGRSLESGNNKQYLIYRGKNLNDRFLNKKHGGHKEVAQHFSSTKRKELSSQNSISSKNILQ